MAGGWLRLALILVALGGTLAALSPASAQTPGRTVTVIAEGEARGEPDIAFLNAGVEANGATPREALARVNDQMQAVLAALQRAGIAGEDIQTSGLNIFTMTGPPERTPAGPPVVLGYRASNFVSVTVRDLSRVETLIDALVEAGITNLGGLRFGVSDTTALHQRALADAVLQARPLAEAAARAAGLAVGEVESIEELSGFGGPAPEAALSGRGGAPVEPGMLTLGVRVQVTFRVAG